MPEHCQRRQHNDKDLDDESYSHLEAFSPQASGKNIQQSAA
jgi:hypothetical protein